MFILDLPPFYLLSLFKDWISVQTICKLDHSFCCVDGNHRKSLHHLIRVKQITKKKQHSLARIVIQSPLIGQNEIVAVFQLNQYDLTMKNQNFQFDHNKLLNVVYKALDTVVLQTLHFNCSISGMLKNTNNVAILHNTFGCYIGEVVFKNDGANLVREGYGEQHWVPKEDGCNSFHDVDVACTTGSLIYCGKWKDDMCEGEGDMVYLANNVYSGNWKNHKRHGKGFMSYSNSSIFDGYWYEGVRCE